MELLESSPISIPGSGIDGIRYQESISLLFSILFLFLFFFRLKETNLAMTAGYKGRIMYPFHNMKLYLWKIATHFYS